MNSDTLKTNRSLFFTSLCKLKRILNHPITWESKTEEQTGIKGLLEKSLKAFSPDKRFSREEESLSDNKDAIKANNEFNEFVKALSSDPMPYVRKNAALSLGKLGDKRAIEYLTRSLRDENMEVRMSSARALGQLGDDVFIDKLIETLKDSNKYLREQTVSVLVSVGEKAVPQLINTLKSDDWMLSYVIVSILGRIGTPSAISSLIDLLEDEGNIYVCKASGEAIEKIGPGAETELLKAFDDKPAYVKEKILSILCKTGGEKTIEKLNASMEQERDGRLKKSMEECVRTIRASGRKRN